jgi:hypothetical protein
MYVVSAIAAPPKANPISNAAGAASTAHQECTSPIATITSRNASE